MRGIATKSARIVSRNMHCLLVPDSRTCRRLEQALKCTQRACHRRVERYRSPKTGSLRSLPHSPAANPLGSGGDGEGIRRPASPRTRAIAAVRTSRAQGAGVGGSTVSPHHLTTVARSWISSGEETRTAKPNFQIHAEPRAGRGEIRRIVSPEPVIPSAAEPDACGLGSARHRPKTTSKRGCPAPPPGVLSTHAKDRADG